MKEEFAKILNYSVRIARSLKRRQKLALLGAICLMALTAALNSVPAVALGRLVDFMLERNTISFSQAYPFIIAILVAILLREALQVARKYLVEDTCTRIEKSNLVEIVAHLLRLDYTFLSGQKTGALHGRVHRSLEGLVKLVKLSFLDFFPALFTSAVAFAVAFAHDPLLGLLTGLVIPSGFIIVLRQIKTQKGIRITLLRRKEEIDGKVIELLGGIETVRAVNTVDFETAKVEWIAEGLRQKEIQHHVSMAFYDAFKYLNEGGFHVLVLCVSILFATQNLITIGEILTFSMLFYNVVNPLREIHRILDEAHESSIRVEDLYALKDLPLDRSFVQNGKLSYVLVVPRSEPVVDICNLFFSYSNGNSGGQVALNDLTLNIQKGERIGIAGPSGCGKSTLLKILLRIIHYEQGKIRVNGRALCALSRDDIAKIIGYVSQTPFLFSGMIAENIAYGFEDFDLEAVKEAARLANIHHEIENMADGYSALVAERGSNLSGGQRQRIALARVFLRKPDLVILDEATSALDNANETIVLENIEKTMHGKTILMVAHRLTTLQNTDKIFVFDKGQIVESGSYDELLNRRGSFFRLAHSNSGS